MAKEYIEREALKPLEEMKYIYFKSPAAVPYYEADKVWEVLDNIPAADVVEVVHGRWIKLDMCKGMENFKCSIRKSECYVPTCMGEPMYAFCPNCGNPMDGKENDHE